VAPWSRAAATGVARKGKQSSGPGPAFGEVRGGWGCKLDSQSTLCALPRQSKRWETLWPMMEQQQGMGKYYGHSEGRKK
jgi:hypothetical protein